MIKFDKSNIQQLKKSKEIFSSLSLSLSLSLSHSLTLSLNFNFQFKCALLAWQKLYICIAKAIAAGLLTSSAHLN